MVIFNFPLRYVSLAQGSQMVFEGTAQSFIQVVDIKD